MWTEKDEKKLQKLLSRKRTCEAAALEVELLQNYVNEISEGRARLLSEGISSDGGNVIVTLEIQVVK